MTTRKPAKIPARQQTTNGKNGGRRWWSTTSRQDEPVIRRRAWYLKTCVCCEMTEDNMEVMRKNLSTCQAVKTTLKLTPTTLSWGRNGPSHRIKRKKIPLIEVTSIEQDDIFVNMLMCILELGGMPGSIKYEITAFKFHDTADVRAIVTAFHTWTGAGPIERAPSIINGSVLVRSVAGGSVHSLAMPGRPTNGSLAPDRWVAVDRQNSRPYLSASMSNLTDVFYPNGTNTMVRNGTVPGTARINHTNGNIVTYRNNRTTPDVTSDEGNGSLSFSDQAHQHNSRHVICSDVEASIAEPVSSDLQPVFNYQRYRPHALNHQSVADIACQVVIPNGVDMRPYTSGTAVVMTGGGGSGASTRMTRSSGIGRDSRDFDDMSDDISMMSGASSAFDEPRLTTRGATDGIAVAHVNGNRGQRRQFNGIFDEVDDGYTNRQVAPPSTNGVPHMSSAVHRVYSRPVRSGSEISLAHDAEYPSSRRSRYQSTDGYLSHVHGGAVRSRSAGPIQSRYARSDLGIGAGSPVVIVDNTDAVSIAASSYSLRPASVLISPNFEKRYVPRQSNSIYRQAPRPVYVSTSSGYGGVRSRTMSHRMQ